MARPAKMFVLWLSLLVVGGAMFSCGGSGGGSDNTKERLRREYRNDPDGFNKKWGFD